MAKQELVRYKDVTGQEFNRESENAEFFDCDGNLVDEVPIDELMDTYLLAQPKNGLTLYQPPFDEETEEEEEIIKNDITPHIQAMGPYHDPLKCAVCIYYHSLIEKEYVGNLK